MEQITKNEFERLLDNNPELTTHGFGVDAEYRYDVKKERADLFNLYDEFLVCCQFLSQLNRRKTANRRWHTYRVKHKIERWASSRGVKPHYIPEGACVAAAVYLGFNFKHYKKYPHILLNISEKSILDGRRFREW